MKVHINAIIRGIDLIFHIPQKGTVSDLNNHSKGEIKEHFAKVFIEAKVRCKGYKHDDVKSYELQWTNKYLERFSLGTPYHLLLSNYIDFLNGDISEITDSRIYFFKGGKRQMSGFDWIQDIEKARGEKSIGDIILPTHNFELLKAHRLKNVFEPEKAKLIEENKINKIGTDEIDVRLLYIQFLNDELKAIDNWIERINKLSTKVLYKAEIIQIEKYRLFINDEISKPETTNSLRSSKKKKPIGYHWQGNAEIELPILHQRLIKAEMIDEQTTLIDFKATFTGQVTDNIRAIKWIADNRLLAYFLDTSFNGQIWQSIADKGKHFINKNSKTIRATDLAAAKSNYKLYGKPKDHKRIDEILSAIKKH